MMISYTKSFIFWLTYAGFAATSFLFVQQTLKDYVEEKTSFQESISVITASDYPTLTICFDSHKNQDMVYGKHFEVKYQWDKKITNGIKLREGENEFTDRDGITHQLKLKKMIVWRLKKGVDKHALN